MLAPEWSRPILERMPEVRAALSFPLGHGVLELATRRRIGKSLAGQYDQAILLPNSLKSALVPFFAKASRCAPAGRASCATACSTTSARWTSSAYPLMIERFMALAYEPDAELPTALSAVRAWRSTTTSRAAALARVRPGVWTARCWRCARAPSSARPSAGRPSTTPQVAEQKIRDGWQVWLFGSKSDHAVGEEIRARLIPGLREEAVNLAGETSLAEAIDLLSCSDAVVSNDSGPDARGCRAQRPLVAVYGSHLAALHPAAGRAGRDRLRLGLECSPCFERTCRFGHYDCLRNLQPDAVLDALQRLAGDPLREPESLSSAVCC